MTRVRSRSFRRKLLAAALSVAVGVLLYQATFNDSWGAARPDSPEPTPATGAKMEFVATAYCKGQTTRSGVNVRAGIAAADPKLLPEGSVIQVDGVPAQYRGIYTVLDTGPAVKGRQIDVYMWSCHEALAFGRRPISITVLRLGWNPNAIAPRTK